ncbi:MAG TPA: amidohydrolase family protein [bacterium]|nr:amidohydrolase family protein [bacterium]
MAASSGPRRLIIDSQVHIWKAETPDRPWPAGGAARAHLPEPFGYDPLVSLMNEAGVDRTILVPPSWEGDRNDYALEAAATFPDRFAVMGRIRVDDPASAALLSKWRDRPGMLGIRLTFLGSQASWVNDGTAEWFWPAAEKARIPVMCLIRHGPADLARIAEQHPQLTLILDHMGLAGEMHLGVSDEASRARLRAGAIAQTVSLSRYPNVSVKLSSAPAYSFEAYPFRDMASHIRRVVDAYGPRRCYWGTDLTKAVGTISYRDHVRYFTEALEFLSEQDKDWIMGRAILARLGWAA